LPSTQTRVMHTGGRVRIDQSDVYTCWLHLFFCWRRLGVPFIDPRGLGAVESNPGRQFLPSVGWCTGHCPVPDFLPKLAQSTVAVLEPLAHRTLSGAHRTVRCPHLTVDSATRHARIARPTIGAVDRWLTGQSGAPLDSPVNYSRTPPDFPESGLFTGVQPGAPDTVLCTTGQSGVPD
jgi:hypothetical protein